MISRTSSGSSKKTKCRCPDMPVRRFGLEEEGEGRIKYGLEKRACQF